MENACKINRWEQRKQTLNNISVADFDNFLNENKEVILLDCRKPNEFATGHLPNAKNIDYFGDNFYEDLDNLDKKQTYLVCCRSGRRSLRTCMLMKNSGFEKVYNLEEGLKRLTIDG